MLLIFWLVAFFVAAIPYTIYYNRWQADYLRLTGAAQAAKFSLFLRGPVDDAGLEQRRRIGAYASYALIGWGIMGLVIPVG